MESYSTRYHLILGEYFINQPLYLSQNLTNIRKVSELFWQLRKAHNWKELLTQIELNQLVLETWAFNPDELQATWTEIENTHPKSLLKTYDKVLNQPEFFMWMVGKNSGTSKLFTILAQLFFYKGYYDEAFKMADHIRNYFSNGKLSIIWEAIELQCQLFIIRGEEKDMQAAWDQVSNFKLIVQVQGDPIILDAILSCQATILQYTNQMDESMKIVNEHKLLMKKIGKENKDSTWLGIEASAYSAKGDMITALNLHKEEEIICREINDLDGLQKCLGNKANVLQKQNQYDQALAMLLEQEKICLNLGKLDSMANCYSNQAFAYAQLGDNNKAIELLVKQEKLARKIGSKKYLKIALDAQKMLRNL